MMEISKMIRNTFENLRFWIFVHFCDDDRLDINVVWAIQLVTDTNAREAHIICPSKADTLDLTYIDTRGHQNTDNDFFGSTLTVRIGEKII